MNEAIWFDIPTMQGRVRMRIRGAGTPAVIFEGGIGEGMEAWLVIFREVSRFTQAIQYDRLGRGGSDATEIPRDSAHIASELREALWKWQGAARYVLVGHSAGAFHVRMFAHLFPEAVAGLVLVEPSQEDWLEELKIRSPAQWRNHMGWRERVAHPEAVKRELQAWDACIEEMRHLDPLPAVPVTLISAVAGHSCSTEILFRMHQHWIAGVPNAKHVITDRSGHFVQRDEPELVVDAICEMVEEIRN